MDDDQGDIVAADPDTIESIRATAQAARGGMRTPRKRADRPAAARRVTRKQTARGPASKRPAYGKQVAAALKTGAVMLEARRPVDAAIIRQTADAMAPLIDQAVAEDPRIAAVLDRFGALFTVGSARGALLATVAAGVAAIAVNNGVAHPLLVAVVGTTLDAARADAAWRLAEQEAKAGDPDGYAVGNVQVSRERVAQYYAALAPKTRPAPDQDTSQEQSENDGPTPY